MEGRQYIQCCGIGKSSYENRALVFYLTSFFTRICVASVHWCCYTVLFVSFVIVEDGASFPEPAADTMLDFRLKVRCKHNSKAPKGSEDPNELYLHSKGRQLLRYSVLALSVLFFSTQ